MAVMYNHDNAWPDNGQPNIPCTNKRFRYTNYRPVHYLAVHYRVEQYGNVPILHDPIIYDLIIGVPYKVCVYPNYSVVHYRARLIQILHGQISQYGGIQPVKIPSANWQRVFMIVCDSCQWVKRFSWYCDVSKLKFRNV